MKKHVIHGYDIIKESLDIEVAGLLILHHERLDGSGYPKGLKDTEISLLGRILAVVDSFDAMTTDRIYKRGKDYETTLKELYSLSHQYDIEIV
ncbi:MAG: HD domain-containing protein [Clostridiales bacterium]|nr:HD domain-containing protein [Clostridiales bacterium]